MSMFNKWYNVEHLIKLFPKALYYLAIGERSNGKTYSALVYGLKEYITKGLRTAYVRRYTEDIKRRYMTQLYASIVENGELAKMVKGTEWEEYDDITYYNGQFFLTRPGDGSKKGRIKAEEPFAFTFAISAQEHGKGPVYPRIGTIIFDEFLTRGSYLPDEPTLFGNVVSTIVRQGDGAKVFMLANTVSKFSPYFQEMGLKHMQDMEQGAIDQYTDDQGNDRVIVEYCKPSGAVEGKPSDKYFQFDSPSMKMITEGSWETAQYPRLKEGYKREDVVTRFLIHYEGQSVVGEIVSEMERGQFAFFYPADHTAVEEDGTPDWRYKDWWIYSDLPPRSVKTRMALTKQSDRLSRVIMELLRTNRTFYSSNEVGEVVRAYIRWSRSFDITN